MWGGGLQTMNERGSEKKKRGIRMWPMEDGVEG